MRTLALLLALAVSLATGSAFAEEEPRVEEPTAEEHGPLSLRFGAGAHYGQNAGGVLALLGLGLHLDEEFALYFEGDLGIGQLMGQPGDHFMSGEAVAVRAGPIMLGLQRRAATGYTVLGALLGAFFDLGSDPFWGVGLRLGVGDAPGYGLDWSLRATFEVESWFI